MEKALVEWLLSQIGPIFISGMTFIGIATGLNWLKRKGFLRNDRVALDRRKVNDDAFSQLLKMYEQNTKYLHALVEINIEQKKMLEHDLEYHKTLETKINEIHNRIVNG